MAGNAPSQASVSESNRGRVLQHLYRHGVESRASIAKDLQLTPAAITKITGRLLDAGVIRETGNIEGGRNRRSIGIELDRTQFHVVGVKFARSLVAIGVFDLAGTPLELQELPCVGHGTIPQTLEAIHAAVESLIAADPAILAVGMAVPGPYLKNEGRTAVVSSMQEWRAVNFLDEFRDAFGVPVFVEQDARAGVLAQRLFNPGESGESLAYYLIGEGVGCGVLERGATIDGAQGAATELGHISIDVAGRPCECGNVGCLERYCSAVAIHEELNAGTLVPGSESMTHREACMALFALAREGDGQALELVRRIGRYVGYGAVTIFNAFNPSRIVLGDIVAEAGEPLLEAVRETVHERVLPALADATSIELSSLPADAAIAGAAAVAITQVLTNPSRFFDVA